MDIWLIVCLILSFLITFLIIPLWIKKTRDVGLVEEDWQKIDKPKVSEAGGLIVLIGFLVSVFFYVAIKTFVYKIQSDILDIFAICLSVLIVSMIGFTDDILTWKKGFRQWVKPVLTIFASLPLIIINIGQSTVNIPFIGNVNFGLFYPLLLIPLGVVGASNGFNILAGYNGLETGMGIIILGFIGFVSFLNGQTWLTVIALCAVFSLIAFLIFNKNPAKVFGGDVLTYFIGGLIACLAIAGNMEKIALILFIPYFIEIILKARSKFQAYSMGIPQPDGTIEKRYEKIYGLEHFFISFLKKIKPSHKVYERDVVWSISIMEILIVFIIILFV